MFLFLRVFFCCLCVLVGAEEVSIRGILLVPNEEILKSTDTTSVEGAVNQDVILPGNGQKLLDDLDKKYVGQPLTLEELIKIKRAIIRYYRKEHHPAVSVRIPPQDSSQGVVAFIIVEAKVGAVVYEGNRWVTKDHLEKYIDIHTGDFISEDILMNNIAWSNRNPFRRTVVVFAPGSIEGTTDLKFISEDRFPVRLFAGADNAGTRFTGYDREYGGMTWGNAFGIGDVLHYQYTINSNLNKFQSHYGSYTSFLPWKNILTVFGKYEKTVEGGKFVQGSVRYIMPIFPLYGPVKREAAIGADYKNINTNLFFVEHHPRFAPMVNIFQVYLNYAYEWVWKKNELELALELYFSPGEWLANQSKHDYRRLRPHAKNIYTYGQLTLGDVYLLPHKFSVSGNLRLQGSFQPLLPCEQFGLGGYNTVRGYREREFNADEALCANAELRFPTIRLMKKKRDELIFLGFIDYGLGYNLQPSKGYPSSGHLLGIGPGMRYQIDTHFSVRVDYGVRLLRDSGSMFHAGIEGIF